MKSVLDSYKLDYISVKDRPDTADRLARECLERPTVILDIVDMPDVRPRRPRLVLN